MSVRFTRKPTTYDAATDTRVYQIMNVGGAWYLSIWEVREVAGLKLSGKSVAHDVYGTKREAVAVARAYDELGDDYSPAEHGYLERFTKAVITAYED